MGKNAHPPRNNTAAKNKPTAEPDPVKQGSGGKKKPGSGQAATPAESSSKSKGKKAGNEPPTAVEEPPKKPTVREIIGGSSWTGKLPVNMLSEHCQKQKWEKPDYYTGKNAEGFFCSVTLAQKNPKTSEITTLPPFKIPSARMENSYQPTALEAKHFAATWALFRVCNMKNLHSMMPPNYRDLWKGDFDRIKKEDVAAGKAWQYEADPFLAAQKRQDEIIAKEKKIELAKKAATNRENAPGSGLTLHGGSSGDLMKGWKTAPKIDMGRKTRREVEFLVRNFGAWNVNEIQMTKQQATAIVTQLSSIGFRKSHVEEAVSIVHSKEEALEWLIVHVPEEDLPKWCLPENYVAGVSIGSTNMKRESEIKAMSAGGYPREACEAAYDNANGDTVIALKSLQDSLIGSDCLSQLQSAAESVSLEENEDPWAEEQEILKSILEERYKKVSAISCRVRIELSSNKAVVNLEVRKPISGYPHSLPYLLLEGNLPAYIRLSIVRQALLYAADNLLGVQMVYNLADWVENEASSIIDNPGKLVDVIAPTFRVQADASAVALRARTSRRHPKPLDTNIGSEASIRILKEWERRQSEPKQQTMLRARQGLPAWLLQHQIADAVRSHQVTIISGETGSGKSTQSVQFILDDMIQRELGAAANIICTQPRRISALGLADRVADERCSSVGQEVGYAIRGDSKQTPGSTRITFVTTGILLRRLQTSGGSQEDVVRSLADVSCVVVDEVHERSVDSDFLLCLLRDVLKKRRDLKLVLMSATLDAQTFASYFRGLGEVAQIEISGRTHPVTDLFLDDVLRMTGYSTRGMEDEEDTLGGMQNSANFNAGKAIQSLGFGINYELISSLVNHIDGELGSQDGAILIFLPGVAEINKTLDALSRSSHVHGLPLHAGLLPAEQKRVFPSAPRGKRKVIASTNVAETSITIPDVVAVIDSGRVKETQYDPATSMVKLVECWASRAACKQRRGRAGRVRAGICYKLFTRAGEARMAERPEPEIRRMPLEQLCLSVKAMGVQDVPHFLGQTLTPPESLAVEEAIRLLRRVGALDGNVLTPLGQHMSMIPADLRCAKLMVYGTLFGCLDACLTIASTLTIKSPFVSPMDKRDEAKSARESFAKHQGDIVADLHAFDAWSAMRADRAVAPRELRAWCAQNFLSMQTLNDIASTRSQYLSALSDTGFLPSSYHAGQATTHPLNRNGTSSPALLHALILSALHPNTLRIQLPSQKYQASISGATAIDPEAREIRFFDAANSRAFVHPSSTLFSAQSFSSGPAQAAFMAYWQKVETSKAFVRELAPAGVYSMCLFGGEVEIDAHGRGLVVDGWARVRGWARIGVLLGRMKAVMDGILRRWIEEPGTAGEADEKTVDLVRRLVELDGLDN